MQTFTEMFLDYAKDAESPESFFTWASYAAIAATLRDNVYLDLGIKQVWPNIYVIVMARSAALRKSVPLQIAGKLLGKVGNTKIIKGRSSIQAVVMDLAKSETNPQTGQILAGASGILISEELASFSPEDQATIPLLTDLYDNHENWSNNLIYSGKTVLKNTCVTMLAATNEPFFKKVYTVLAIRGGLLGRTFIIRESQRKCKNSLMYTDVEAYDTKPLVDFLKTCSLLKGTMEMTLEAKQEYDSWYKSIDYDRISSDTGVVERLHWGVLKLSIILAVGSTLGLTIQKQHIEEAISKCVALVKNYEAVSMGIGNADHKDALAQFLSFLNEVGGRCTREKMLGMNWSYFDSYTLDNVVVSTLQGGGLIRTVEVEGKVGFELTPKGREIFERKV